MDTCAATSGNTTASGGHTFLYDFEDRLAQYDATVAMKYDGDGNRVSRTQGGTEVRYLIDELNPTGWPQVAEEVVSGSVTVQYTHGQMRISQRRDSGSGFVTSYYGYDAGGSVRQLFDTSGAVTDTYAYDAFGNTVASSGSTVNVYLYRGEQFDPTLGMYYLRARYYVPKTGRFLTLDKFEGPDWTALCNCGQAQKDQPIDPRHHLYVYTGADPVNYVDPSGHRVSDRALIIGAAFGTYLIFVDSSVVVGFGSCFIENASGALNSPFDFHPNRTPPQYYIAGIFQCIADFLLNLRFPLPSLP